MGVFNDLTGQKFNRLTVIRLCGRDKYGKILYECQCDCGNKCVTHARSLKSGHCKSCGCYNHDIKIEKSKYKGLAQKESGLYVTWKSMIARCCNQNNKSYHDYGGRGIAVVCDWSNPVDGFANFVRWSKENGYRPGLTIDRINNDDGYSPDNCRWANWITQANNRRKPSMVRNQYGIWHYRPLPELPKEETVNEITPEITMRGDRDVKTGENL